ncbi:MAG TPA: hypothetical protein VGM54_08740 [Chthoniobacter sp.]|jgi:hypothetical protein
MISTFDSEILPTATTSPHARRSIHHLLTRIVAGILCFAVCGLSLTSAQEKAKNLSPEIAPLAAKYQSDLTVLTGMREKALAQNRQTYLAVLASAQQRANNLGKTDEAKAASDEKDTLTAGRDLTPLAAPMLPRELATSRAYFLREASRAEHEYAVHAQEVAAQYLQGLLFFETKAKSAGQADLLKQIAAEKVKLAAQGAGPRPARGTGRNLVLNGDFSRKNADGTPESWGPGAPGKGVVANEVNTTFLRVVSTDKKETYFLENLDRPAEAQELAVTVRLRCPGLKEKGEYGLVVAQRDAANNLLARDAQCLLKVASPTWRTLNSVVRILPETKHVIIRCNLVDAPMTVDFAEVRVEPR